MGLETAPAKTRLVQGFAARYAENASESVPDHIGGW
jgi:hypothetical protein